MWHVHSLCLDLHLSLLNLLFVLAFAFALVIVVPSTWIKKPDYPSNSLMATVTSSLLLLLPCQVSPRELFAVSLHYSYSSLFGLPGSMLFLVIHDCDACLVTVLVSCIICSSVCIYIYIYIDTVVVIICQPVIKWVHVIILFFKGLCWLCCWPQLPLIYVSMLFNIPFHCQSVCYLLCCSHMFYSWYWVQHIHPFDPYSFFWSLCKFDWVCISRSLLLPAWEKIKCPFDWVGCPFHEVGLISHHWPVFFNGCHRPVCSTVPVIFDHGVLQVCPCVTSLPVSFDMWSC